MESNRKVEANKGKGRAKIEHAFMAVLVTTTVSYALTAHVNCQAQTPPSTSRPQSDADVKKLVDQIYNSIPNTRQSTQIPANFPIQNYASNVSQLSFSHSTKGQPSAAASILTRDRPRTVFEWYQSSLRNSGWTTKSPSAKAMSEMGKEDQLFIIEGEKEKHRIYLFLTPNKQGGTAISVTWTKAPQSAQK